VLAKIMRLAAAAVQCRGPKPYSLAEASNFNILFNKTRTRK